MIIAIIISTYIVNVLLSIRLRKLILYRNYMVFIPYTLCFMPLTAVLFLVFVARCWISDN
jgi:hypothetical protein